MKKKEFNKTNWKNYPPITEADKMDSPSNDFDKNGELLVFGDRIIILDEHLAKK